MKCVNCGRELPPDTVECPFCIEKETRKGEAKNERRKIYFTLGFCALVLALIAAAVLIFMPDNSFRRDMENAESSYAVADLCESSPAEAGDSRYQLILMDAAEDIGKRYENLTCGYNQTVTALGQLYMAENDVVRDRVEEIWSCAERKRFFSLLNHKRTERGLHALTWDDSLTAAAESVADEYGAVGMDYLNNIERLIRTLLPEPENISAALIYDSVNAQDALVRYELDEDDPMSLMLYSDEITAAGADAYYNEASAQWCFFVLTAE